jgi:uncharacterized protein YyaL (SSP411 family)
MADSNEHKPNRLIHETSPYLVQHAYNPVDWYPWGEEAFAKARAEDKPIHLSVGYAACHWCHVLAHESFEDPETAQIMNHYFVNIKVDREERPDIDSIYMTVVQAMTGGGGWPMTVFMTPDGVPFYGGTYFPPTDRQGMPSFTRVLLSVADAYRNRRSQLLEAGEDMVTQITAATSARMPEHSLSLAVQDNAFHQLEAQFDEHFGGFGGAPKFPQAMTYEFLLRYAHRTGNEQALAICETSLRKMAEGGIYDQLGGGFHRYSVDNQWLVPHFEKMLYDNALLTRVYIEAYQTTQDPFYRRIAEETLDYLVREMRHPAGGFYSTQDADSLPSPDASHNEEGAFFVWTPAQLRQHLSSQEAMVISAIYDVTEGGNFEGLNILHVVRTPAQVARTLGQTEERVNELLASAKAKLFAIREQRPKPGLDDKILTAWNGMALRAFAMAARAFERDDYRDIARACGEFALQTLCNEDGIPIRAWRDRASSGLASTASALQRGFLEDHALLADGLIALYEATFETRWLEKAQQLADRIIEQFWDDGIAGFYDTASDHESLIVRPRDIGDNATPSGNAAAADVLARLAIIFDNRRYRSYAERVLSGIVELAERFPGGFGRYLATNEFVLAPVKEIALVGDPASSDLQALTQAIFTPFIPNKVVLLLDTSQSATGIASPLLEQRQQIQGKATAYVCENYACQLPVTTPEELLLQLS